MNLRPVTFESCTYETVYYTSHNKKIKISNEKWDATYYMVIDIMLKPHII